MLVMEPTLRNEKQYIEKDPSLKIWDLSFTYFVVIIGKLMKNIFQRIADITSTTNLFSEWKTQNSKGIDLTLRPLPQDTNTF